jgi:uncharacterized secreted protein with C-terminal beta-propeller domain
VTDDGRPARRRARMWMLLPTATTALAATAVIVATSVSTSHPSKTDEGRVPIIPGIHPAAQLLTPFASCDRLVADLRKHALAHLDRFGPIGIYSSDANKSEGGAFAPSAASREASTVGGAADAGGGTGAGTSTTNVQEAGVDEPDIVKTANGRVVTVTDGHLRVLDAAGRTQTGDLDLRQYNGWQGAQLLVSGDKAIVLMTNQNYAAGYGPGFAGGAAELGPVDGPRPLPQAENVSSTLLYADLAGTPRITGHLTVDGSILDARMVGTTARVVASSGPHIQPRILDSGSTNDYKVATRSAIKSAPLKNWLPSYSVGGGGAQTVPCASVDHPVDYSAASMLTIYTADPTQPDADPQPVSLTADGGTVYATAASMYIASNPDCAWCGTEAGGTTQIHRFDIRGADKPTYLGSGSVAGSLLSQYSLSDYDGYLRVATTTVAKSNGETVSGVVVLDAATLKQAGSVGGLGKGERVYAVRFLDALGYVVTFNQQDPLYVLDLSKPTAPRQVGALEIPGFSSYLHDVGSGRLLGVGQDTTLVKEGGGEYAHNEGRMVQLFDVSRADKPTRTAKIVVPHTGTPGDPSFDPHAFLFWKDTGLVVVPIANYGNGGVLAVRLEGSRLVQVGTVTNPGDELGGAIERSMIVNGDLWTFSPSGVQVTAQSSLARISWIPFA